MTLFVAEVDWLTGFGKKVAASLLVRLYIDMVADMLGPPHSRVTALVNLSLAPYLTFT